MIWSTSAPVIHACQRRLGCKSTPMRGRAITPTSMSRPLRRAVASRLSRRKIRDVLTTFSGSVRIEGVHPLQLGIVRRKVRTQRRYGMPIPSPLVFYPKAIAECARAIIRWGLLWYRYHRMITRIHADPAAPSYLDEALRPHSGQAEVDSLLRRLLTRFLRLTV